MKFGGYDSQAQLAAPTEVRDRDEQRKIRWNENCECVLSLKRSQKTKRWLGPPESTNFGFNCPVNFQPRMWEPDIYLS